MSFSGTPSTFNYILKLYNWLCSCCLFLIWEQSKIEELWGTSFQNENTHCSIFAFFKRSSLCLLGVMNWKSGFQGQSVYCCNLGKNVTIMWKREIELNLLLHRRNSSSWHEHKPWELRQANMFWKLLNTILPHVGHHGIQYNYFLGIHVVRRSQFNSKLFYKLHFNQHSPKWV